MEFKETIEERYEEHIRMKAMDDMDDGEWGPGIVKRKEEWKNKYTLSDYKRDWGDD